MSAIHTPQHNLLLAALPANVKQRLSPHLERVALPLGMTLYESGDAVRHVYFPNDAIVSLMRLMRNGASAEISMVGNDGLVGIAEIMGGESAVGRAVVQGAGTADRLPVQWLKDEFSRHGELMLLTLRYAQSLITQVSLTAACNRHHTIDQQLCRWLLLSLDRMPGNRLTLTQELIAGMLGVRRESVTDAAGKLQKLGMIKYARGEITVLNRPGLEKLSCECYAAARKESGRLQPYLCGPRVVPERLTSRPSTIESRDAVLA